MDKKTITVKVDDDLLVEFAVAVRILRGRSVSSHVHQFLIREINAARQMVTPEEFQALMEEQRAYTLDRSRSRSEASRKPATSANVGVKRGRVVGGQEEKTKKTGGR
jgi:hypothetical protein